MRREAKWILAACLLVGAVAAQAQERDFGPGGPADDPVESMPAPLAFDEMEMLPGGVPGAPAHRVGPQGRGRGFGMHGRGPRGLGGLADGPLAEELNLTAAQRQQLRDIHDRRRRAAIRARADLGVANLDLAKLMRDEKPDRAAIEAQIDRIAHMRAELRKSQVGAMLEGRSVLTEAQRKKLEQLRTSRRMPRGDGPRGEGPRARGPR